MGLIHMRLRMIKSFSTVLFALALLFPVLVFGQANPTYNSFIGSNGITVNVQGNGNSKKVVIGGTSTVTNGFLSGTIGQLGKFVNTNTVSNSGLSIGATTNLIGLGGQTDIVSVASHSITLNGIPIGGSTSIVQTVFASNIFALTINVDHLIATNIIFNGTTITNIVQSDVWTLLDGDVFTTDVTATNVLAENFEVFGASRFDGRVSLGSTSTNLSLGTNDIFTMFASDLALVSPTNNPALVFVRLSAPDDVQILFLENGSTNVWTLKDGQANSDFGVVHLQGGDFTTGAGTNLVLMLKGSGNDWQEVQRFQPGNTNGFPIINPTRDYIPYKVDNTHFGDSPLIRLDATTVGVGNISNKLSSLGNDLTYSNSAAANGSYIRISGGGTAATLAAKYGVLGGDAHIQAGLAKVIWLEPNAATGAAIVITPGAILPSISNSVDLGSASNPFKTLYLQTNTLRLGTNIYTDNGTAFLRNGVPVGGGGGDSLWTNRSSSVIEPLSTNISLILLERQPDLGQTNRVVIWPRIIGSTIDAGSFFDISDTLVDQYGYYSTNSGTSSYYNFQLSNTNAQLVISDGVGGTATINNGFLSLSGQTNLLGMAANQLTLDGVPDGPFNQGEFAGQDQLLDGNIGVYNYARLSGVQQMVTNSQDIVSMGIGAGFLRTLIRSTNIMALGADAGELMFATNVTDFLMLMGGGDTAFVFDSGQITSIGRESLGDSVIHDSFNLHFQNSFSGAHVGLDGIANLDASGYQSAQYFAGTNSSDLIFSGTGAGDHAVANDSSAISYIGNQAGYSTKMTNSDNVTFIGKLAGTGMTGSYTNRVFFSGSLTTPDPGSGVADWKLGKVITGASVALVATNYVEVSIAGTVRKLALVQ